MGRSRVRLLMLLTVAVVVVVVSAPSALAKLPPVDAWAPASVPIGGRVPVRLWFVDRAGAALPAGEAGAWKLSEQVVGDWMWAYPARRGRPDPAHEGIRIPLSWHEDHYEGSFVVPSTGPWLVIPFGADHRMPDPYGPAEPIEVMVDPLEGVARTPSGSAPRAWPWLGAALVLVGGLGTLVVRGRGTVAR